MLGKAGRLQPLLVQTCTVRLPAWTSSARLSRDGTLTASLALRSLSRGGTACQCAAALCACQLPIYLADGSTYLHYSRACH